MPQNDEGLTEGVDDARSEEPHETLDRRRVVRCPFTGRRVIATCPDGTTVSSREMYVLLRDGDPVDLFYLDVDRPRFRGGRGHAAE